MFDRGLPILFLTKLWQRPEGCNLIWLSGIGESAKIKTGGLWPASYRTP
jgi:hypothetical protein